MADTTWKNVPGTNPQLQAYVNYDSITRTNNTIYLNGINLQMRVNISGGFDYNRWHGSVTAGQDGGSSNTVLSDRQIKASGVEASNGEVFYSSEGNASFGVDATATSGFLGASAYSDAGGSVGTWDLDIPNLGSPASTDTLDSAQVTSLKTRVNVTTWGANATAGSVRSYIADNSGFSGQVYVGTTDNALVTHSSLTSNKQYWLRGWASNGGGLSGYSSAITGITLPLAPVMTAPTNVEATTATVPTTQDVGGGFYAITKQYSIKKTADATWGAWTTFTADNISLTGLAPNTSYDVRVQSISTAGTTVGSTQSFTTLPAAKLVYEDGTVVNALPRRVNDDGTTTLLNISEVFSS